MFNDAVIFTDWTIIRKVQYIIAFNVSCFCCAKFVPKHTNLVTELINYGVRPMLSTVSRTVTSTMSRQPEVFNLKLTENRNSFCLPSLISNRK